MGGMRIEQAGGVARVVLANPEKHNAFDDGLIADLTAAFDRLGAEAAVRVVRLEAEGKSFSAGADLDWMRRAGAAGHAENLADAQRLARLMQVLDSLPQPTLAVVQGAAYGGGVGLIACCDIALAAEGAKFALSEVKLGLIPAVISPYVIRAIGARQARRFFLTAEVFDAAAAERIGLVHECVPPEALASRAGEVTAALLAAGPMAVRAGKRLVAEVAGRPVDAALIELTAQRIADIRATPEAREGLDAFLSRRRPGWTPEGPADG